MKNLFKILKVYYGFLFKQKIWAGVFLILAILAPIVESLNPYFYKLFVDAIPSLNFSLLINILIAFIVVKFISTFLTTARFFVLDYLFINSYSKTARKVFSHIHDLDFAFHTNKSSGSLISAIKRGEGSYWNLLFSIHIRLIAVAVKFLVMVYFFQNIHINILWFVLISFVFGIMATLIFVKLNIKTRRKVNKEEDKITSVVVDNMINFETVKLFSKEKWEEKRLKDKYEDWKKALWNFVYTFRGLDIGMGTIINVSTFVILAYTILLATRREITVGDFVLVATFLQSFYSQLYELVWGLRDIAKSYSDIERFLGILEEKVRIKDPEDPVIKDSAKGEIEFKGVNFSYEEDKSEAVKNINLEIRQGQSVALVGSSGAGKTTLIKLLLRFWDVDSGSITIDGIDIRKFKKADLRSFFGVVPQEPILFNNTVRYNIAYGRGNVENKEIVAAAKMANIHEFIKTLPKGYKTKVGERGIKLSGGQKQRLAIARMILSDPDIVIFDEATSQLDSESEKLIQEAFWKASKSKTTILIAHRLSTIQRADKIVVMEDGETVEEGSHQSLLSKEKGVYKKFWNLQQNID